VTCQSKSAPANLGLLPIFWTDEYHSRLVHHCTTANRRVRPARLAAARPAPTRHLPGGTGSVACYAASSITSSSDSPLEEADLPPMIKRKKRGNNPRRIPARRLVRHRDRGRSPTGRHRRARNQPLLSRSAPAPRPHAGVQRFSAAVDRAAGRAACSARRRTRSSLRCHEAAD
jgi:hypothetical protein